MWRAYLQAYRRGRDGYLSNEYVCVCSMLSKRVSMQQNQQRKSIPMREHAYIIRGAVSIVFGVFFRFFLWLLTVFVFLLLLCATIFSSNNEHKYAQILFLWFFNLLSPLFRMHSFRIVKTIVEWFNFQFATSNRNSRHGLMKIFMTLSCVNLHIIFYAIRS